jgi:hypothetical protein
MVIYIARLPCGCVIDACEEGDNEMMWVRGWVKNGWIVTRETPCTEIESACPTCKRIIEEHTPRQTMRMF